jgi:hypothetical protein
MVAVLFTETRSYKCNSMAFITFVKMPRSEARTPSMGIFGRCRGQAGMMAKTVNDVLGNRLPRTVESAALKYCSE